MTIFQITEVMNRFSSRIETIHNYISLIIYRKYRVEYNFFPRFQQKKKEELSSAK